MIRVSNLNKVYDSGTRHANHVLHDVCLTLPDTGFICIVGASGCGKTSLLNAIGGLDSFQNGTINTDAVSVDRYGSGEMERERNNSFGYIFQNYYLLNDHSVAYNVYLGLHALPLTHKEKLQRVKEALKAVNMERYAGRITAELSGGQQQRVAIARALARRPRVIFADEPTGNLDEKNTLNICTLLRRISRNSLVVMVTHEETIARFFADRIITISEGRIEKDSDSWERKSFSVSDNDLYAGDFSEETVASEHLSIRVLREEEAPNAHFTVAILKDRIILKLDDERTVSCSTSPEEPVIREGKRPELVLEAVDNIPGADTVVTEPEQGTGKARAGKGLTWSMMLSESTRLLRGKGLKFLSTWIFLVAMTVLTIYMVGDYITISSIDPHDFIITDSHILEFTFERDVGLPKHMSSILPQIKQFHQHLEKSGVDYDVLPKMDSRLSYSTDVFQQMGSVSVEFTGFSHALASRLDESALICGRMPERTDEIVVDRWVLDALIQKDGIVQSSISDITDLLGAQLSVYKSSYAPKIVGICDCGEPTIYFTKAGMATVGKGGTTVLTLSELQEMFPGEYDDMVLENGECMVVIPNVGTMYRNRIGNNYRLGYTYEAVIAGVVEHNVWARVIVSDETLDNMLESMSKGSYTMTLYCADKQALKTYLSTGLPESLQGLIKIDMKDAHGDAWDTYRRASILRADARTIVTVTIIVLCMVMLYLLQRSGVHQRIGMMAVYRLLGIPRRKLLLIFSMESILFSLTSVLPAAILSWVVIRILTILPSLEFSMILPPDTTAAVAGIIALYYLAVSLLPTARLLRLPPARLASKYDL